MVQLGDDCTDFSADWTIRVSSAFTWVAHHTWTNGETDEVDGYLLGPDGGRSQLDIASLGDECCIRHSVADLAEEAWGVGSVYRWKPPWERSVPNLVVPEPALTTDLIAEALRRFQP